MDTALMTVSKPGHGLRLLRNALGTRDSPRGRIQAVKDALANRSPLTTGEIIAVTGLPEKDAYDSLAVLDRQGDVRLDLITGQWKLTPLDVPGRYSNGQVDEFRREETIRQLHEGMLRFRTLCLRHLLPAAMLGALAGALWAWLTRR